MRGPVPVAEDPGRRPQTVGGAIYLLVVAAAVTGLAIVLVGAWRTGVSWLGAGLVVGGLARLVIPERRAGMLRVRRRSTDVVLLLASGTALVVLALVIPDQPG